MDVIARQARRAPGRLIITFVLNGVEANALKKRNSQIKAQMLF